MRSALYNVIFLTLTKVGVTSRRVEMAIQWGSYRVLVLGLLLLTAGLALTPLAASEWSLLLTMGVLSAAGAGAGSFSILIGATAQRLPPRRRSLAAGFINAGGSFGQFVFAPLSQAIIRSDRRRQPFSGAAWPGFLA